MVVNSIDVLLRLINQRRFASGMVSSAASVRGFKEAVEGAGSASSGLARAGYAAEASLFAVGAAARAGTAAVGATMAAFTGLGIAFNSTMEQNTLAFEKFTGGVEQSKDFTADLFDIAKQTPFAFTDITTAARRFLAFGFNVQETTEMLEVMGDTLAYTGGGTDEILRMSKAFGDIRAKGKLMQQELNQLANLNIPFRQIMSLGGLELTEKQWSNVGRAGISAERALNAFKIGLQNFYGGGAEKYMQTFAGQWQRLKDNISLAAGSATSTSGVFSTLRSALASVNEWVEKNGKTINSTYIKVGRVILGVVVGAFKLFKAVFSDLYDAVKPAAPFFNNVLLPFFKGLGAVLLSTVVGAFKIGVFVLKMFMTALGAIGHVLGVVKPLFTVIGAVVGFIFGGAIIKVLGLLGKLPGVFGWISKAVGFVVQPLQGLSNIFGRIGAVAVAAFTGAWNIITNFGDLIGGVFSKIKDALKWIEEKVNWALDKAGELKDKLDPIIPGGGGGVFGTGIGPKLDFPFAASGGTLVSGGWTMVGEKGPELVNLPTGATVINNEASRLRRHTGGKKAPAAEKNDMFAAINLEVRSPIYVDRRQIGEAVGTYVAERKARR